MMWREINCGRSAIFLAALLLLTGCHSFNHDWKASARGPIVAGDLTGHWEGTWASDANQHHDALRCLITRDDDTHYSARFHATYRGTFHFNYTVPLQVTVGTNGFSFQGRANLGWLEGGWYDYAGHTDGTNYFSTYHCKYDRGVLEMRRLEAAAK